MALLDRVGDFAFGLIAWPCVMLYLLVSNDNGMQGYCNDAIRRAKAFERNSSKAMKERKRNEPAALPRRRRNLSTASISENSISQITSLWSSHWEVQDTKTTSPLLLLPLEIREKIYADALGNGILHLIQLPKRLGHIRCTTLDSTLPHGDLTRACFWPSPVQYYRHGELMNPEARSDGCLALLQTCRQIYNEASRILYRTNTFDANHPQTLLFLARTLRPERLESIRYLQLTWSGRLPMIENDADKEPDDLKTWEDMWDTVGERMSGLRSLKLKLTLVDDVVSLQWLQFTRTRWTRNDVQFEKMLERLKMKVRGLSNFELDLEMPEEVDWSIKELEARMRSVVCCPRCIEP
jgi:hypothetical protein